MNSFALSSAFEGLSSDASPAKRAYVACSAIGVVADDYSFGYVARWAWGGDEATGAIKASDTRIRIFLSTDPDLVTECSVQGRFDAPGSRSGRHWPRRQPGREPSERRIRKSLRPAAEGASP
jgi:hypothetical protein